MIYKNVADGISGVDQASEHMISTLKAFGYESGNAIEIANKFNETGNRFAISAAGVGEALQRSSSALASAGNSLDESIGLVVAANEIIQDPEKVGTALKTLALRLRRTKTELEEMGEDSEGAAESTSKLREELSALSGVDIMLNEDTYKSTYQIIQEMSKAWKDMTDVQQAGALELMGGLRQGNVLSSLLSNFEQAESAVDVALNSTGSAVLENEKILDSLQGRINILGATFQQFANNVGNVDLFKGIISGLTGLLNILNTIVSSSGFKTIIGGTLLAKGALSIAQNWDKVSQAFVRFGTSISNLIPQFNIFSKTQKQAVIDSAAEALASEQVARQNYAEALAKEASAKASLNEVAANKLATKSDMEQASASLIAAQNNVRQAEAAVTSAAASSKSAASQAGLATAFGPVGLAITGVVAALTIGKIAYDCFTKAQEEARQAAIDAANSLEHEKSAIESQISSIEELRNKLDEGNISQSEAYSTREQLYDIQRDLIEQYGLEAVAIDLVNGNLKDQIDLLRGVTAEKSGEFLAQNASANEGIVSDFTKDRRYIIGTYVVEDEANGAVKELAKSFESAGIKIEPDGQGQMTIAFEGDISSAQNIITDFMSQLSDIDAALPLTLEFSYAENALQSIAAELPELQEQYNKIGLAKIVSNTESEYNDLYSRLLVADRKFQDAKLIEDETQREKALNDARSEFEALQNELSGLNFYDEDLGRNLSEVEDYLYSLAKMVQANNANEIFNIDIGINKDGLKDDLDSIGHAFGGGTMEASEFRNILLDGAEATETQKAAIEVVTSIMDHYGMTLDTIIAKLVELGYLQGNTEPIEDQISSLTAFGSVISGLSDKASQTATEATALYERLYVLDQEFQNGTISVGEYLNALNTEVSAGWFSGEGQEELELQQALFASLSQTAAETMATLLNGFEDGTYSIGEYLEGLLSASDMMVGLGETLAANADNWDLGIDSNSINTLTETVSMAQAQIEMFADGNMALHQILSGSINSTAEEYGYLVNVISDDLAHIVNTSGEMHQAISSQLGTTSSEIAQSLLEDTGNMNLAASAMAANTNSSISSMIGAVGGLFQELGNAISNFKFEITVSGKGSGIGDLFSSIVGGEPYHYNLTIEPTGGTSTAATFASIGKSIANFGQQLQQNMQGGKIDFEDYFKPIQSGTKAYDNFSNAAKGATKAQKALNDELKRQKEILKGQEDAINSLLEMVIKMIKQEQKLAKEALQDELDGYKKRIDAQKELLDQKEKERDYNRELTQKQKEVSDIEAQLIALRFDDSEAAHKKRLELEDQLNKKQVELSDFQHDYGVEKQKDALDQEYERFKEIKDAEIAIIEDFLSKEGAIRAEAIRLIEERSDELYTRLLQWNSLYGTSIDQDVYNAWNNAYAALVQYNNGQIMVAETLHQIAQLMADVTAQTNAATTAADAYNNAVGGGSGGRSTAQSTGKRYKVVNYKTNKVAADGFTSREAANTYLDSLFDKGSHTVHSYAKGLMRATKAHFADTDEIGDEFIIRKDGSRLRKIQYGDGVVPADLTARLVNIAKSPLGKAVGNTQGTNIANLVKPPKPLPSITLGNFVVQGNIVEGMEQALRKMFDEYEKRVYKTLVAGQYIG